MLMQLANAVRVGLSPPQVVWKALGRFLLANFFFSLSSSWWIAPSSTLAAMVGHGGLTDYAFPYYEDVGVAHAWTFRRLHPLYLDVSSLPSAVEPEVTEPPEEEGKVKETATYGGARGD